MDTNSVNALITGGTSGIGRATANKLAKLSNTPAINVSVGTFNRTIVAQPLTFGIDVSYRLGK